LGNRFSSWYFGKGVIWLMCYEDIHVGDGFVLGFSFWGLLRTWNISFCVFGVFLGVTPGRLLRLTANAEPGASLSRLGKLYFGRGYREDCVIGLILWGFAPCAVASIMVVGYLSGNESEPSVFWGDNVCVCSL